MKLNRRNFMKMLAGVTAAVGLTGKAEEPKENVELTAYGTKEGSKSLTKDYDLIADLVEEMNKFDKKFPDQDINYRIRCSYTGLAFLYETGETGWLHRDYGGCENPPYSFFIYAGYTEKTVRFVSVRVMPKETKSDISLTCFRRELMKNYVNIETWASVTTRCFNVNRDEEGREIAGVNALGNNGKRK